MHGGIKIDEREMTTLASGVASSNIEIFLLPLGLSV